MAGEGAEEIRERGEEKKKKKCGKGRKICIISNSSGNSTVVVRLEMRASEGSHAQLVKLIKSPQHASDSCKVLRHFYILKRSCFIVLLNGKTKMKVQI